MGATDGWTRTRRRGLGRGTANRPVGDWQPPGCWNFGLKAARRGPRSAALLQPFSVVECPSVRGQTPGDVRRERPAANLGAAGSYPRWWNATEPYEVKYKYPYEPYVIAARAALPRYDARFR
jgi:hypothetical protein